MRSWRWWAGGGALPLWGALALLLWSGANALANRALERELDRIRRAGEPLVASQADRPPVPEQADAAPLLLRALDSLREEGPAWVDANANAPALEDLKQAVARPSCRFPIDYSKGADAEIPSVVDLRRAIRLLGAAARIARDRGDADEVDLLLAAALRLGVAAAEEPMLLPAGRSILHAAFAIWDEHLRGGHRPGPAARALLPALRPEMFREAGIASLRLERCLLLSKHLTSPAADAPPLRPWIKWKLARACRRLREAIARASAAPSEEDLRLGLLRRTLTP